MRLERTQIGGVAAAIALRTIDDLNCSYVAAVFDGTHDLRGFAEAGSR